jgi:uncharacterized protein YdeI (YjbR/CyaY-like superfamily)
MAGRKDTKNAATVKRRPSNAKVAEETASFDTVRAWDAWLKKNHASSSGLWMKIAKKGAETASIGYPEALESALAWGWIDAQKKGLDAEWWLQRFTPRGPRSIWSKINRDKAIALIESGKMKPSGLAAVEQAKKNGQWENAYAGQKTVTVPDDLAAALDANPKAKAFFAKLDSVNRYAILHRVHTAMKPETRARRIAKFVEMLAKQETLHP